MADADGSSGASAAYLIVGGLYIDEMHVLPRFPKEDSAMRTLSVTRRRGGNAATNACVLAQLVTAAQPVYWAGPVPKNGAAGAVKFGLDAMEAYGVDVSLHEKVPDADGQPPLDMPTAVILVSQETGSRTIVSSRRGMREISPEWVRNRVLPTLPTRCWIHFEAREFQSVLDSVAAADAVRQDGWRLSIEVEKPSFSVDQLLAFAARVDVCFISREFAEANVHALLAGRPLRDHQPDVPDSSHLALQTLRALEARFEAAEGGQGAEMGQGAGGQGAETGQGQGSAAAAAPSEGRSSERAPRVVWVLAWGALGAFALECVRSGRGVDKRQTKEHFVPAEKVAKVMDSTGAGDTFNAAVISALSSANSVDVGDALRVGCRVAGRKVAQDGFDGLALPTGSTEGLGSTRGQKRKAA